MLDHVNITMVLAVGALVLSGVSPIVFAILQRRAKTVDDRDQRRQEDARRVQVMAEALRRAKEHLVTSAMEYELECVQLAIRASEEAVLLKEQGGVPVLTQTLASISALKEQAHAVEAEIIERKDRGA